MCFILLFAELMPGYYSLDLLLTSPLLHLDAFFCLSRINIVFLHLSTSSGSHPPSPANSALEEEYAKVFVTGYPHKNKKNNPGALCVWVRFFCHTVRRNTQRRS
jgi:hypothetical protein